jgi:hypothetical protein
VETSKKCRYLCFYLQNKDALWDNLLEGVVGYWQPVAAAAGQPGSVHGVISTPLGSMRSSRDCYLPPTSHTESDWNSVLLGL